MKRIKTLEALRKGLKYTFKKNVPLPKNAVTNSDVRNKYIDLVRESGIISSSISRIIEDLVDRGKIIPIVCTDDYIKDLNRNLKGDAAINPKTYEHTLGFYTGDQNRIYILMDHINKFMGNDKRGMFFVTLHELQHMCCYNFPRQFIDLWSKELSTFYGYFMSYLYQQCKGTGSIFKAFDFKGKSIERNFLDNKNGILYLIMYLIYNHEFLLNVEGSVFSARDVLGVASKFAACAQNCGSEDNISMRIYQTIQKFVYDIFFKNIASSYKNGTNIYVINSFRQAYIKTFGIDVWRDTLIYQEAIFPSEVICIMSQYKYQDNRFYKFLNNL